MITKTDWNGVYALYSEARMLFSKDEQVGAYDAFLESLKRCVFADQVLVVKNMGNDEALFALPGKQWKGTVSDLVDYLPLLFPGNSSNEIESGLLTGLLREVGLESAGYQSAACIALDMGSENAFCIVLLRKPPNKPFSPEELSLIQKITEFLGQVVGYALTGANNASIAEELTLLRKRQSVWLETLAWLNELGKSDFRDKDLNIAVFQLQTLVVADSAVAFGYPDGETALACMVQKEGDPLKDSVESIIQNHLTLEEIKPSETKIVVNTENYPALVEHGFVECLCFPLFIKDELNMLLCLARKEAAFDVHEQMVASLFAEGIEHIVERMHLMASISKQNQDLVREKNEQQKLIEKLNEAQIQLAQQEKMASIGQLAAGVAHEINNPVGYVNSNINSMENYMNDLFSLIEEYEKLEAKLPTEDAGINQIKSLKEEMDYEFMVDDVKDLISESKEGIVRVRGIVKDLKDFSHVDQADWQDADLVKGIESTLNIVQNDIKYKAEIIKEYQEIPNVECVSSQINQIVMNLLVNAGHAIETRGTITIRTYPSGDDKVCVEVEDTGKGIAQEHLTKIFDPFFTTKPVGTGTGLGLSLSYSIAEKHGGELSVASEVGKGTTFTLTLPIKHVDIPDEESQDA